MNYVEIKATSEEEETNEQKKWKSNQLHRGSNLVYALTFEIRGHQ